MAIDHAFSKHLPKQYAEVFNSTAEDRTVFLNGTLYEHNGKIRFHTDDTIYGEYWENRYSDFYEKTVHQWSNPERTNESAISTSDGLYPVNEIAELPLGTEYQILSKNHASDKAAPKVFFKIDKQVIDFFATCPELIPESDPKPILFSSTPNPIATSTESGRFPMLSS